MKIFLATPIAGFESQAELHKYKEEIVQLVSRLKTKGTVWAEVDKMFSAEDYDCPQYSLITDLKHITEADIFILHYPKKIVTSALMELGFAVALKKKIIIITPEKSILPYLALGLTKETNTVIVESKNLSDECIKRILEEVSK